MSSTVGLVSDVGTTRPTSRDHVRHNFRNFRISTLNVGTMRGRSGEVVETVSRRKVDIYCLQETRWRGCSARMIAGKDTRYKFFWSGNYKGTGDVRILLAE